MKYLSSCAKFGLWCFAAMVFSIPLSAQNTPDMGSVHGSLQSDVQYTLPAPEIEAEIDSGRVVSNTYLQLTYQKGKFEMGARYEMYLNPLLGGFKNYQGQGIANRYAAYHGDFIDITVGNFYEQFGKGTIFRAYQEWTLGVDNSIDGFRLKLMPYKGIKLTGIIGKQRFYWGRSQGNVRAADLNLQLNEMLPFMEKSKARVTLGASVVSKYQEDNNPDYKLPKNVAAFAGRFAVNYKAFRLEGEGAYKVNDPGKANGYAYDPGNSVYLSGSYAKKGLGITASLRRAENMNFRSERDAIINEATLSFLPPVTKAHTYRLPTLYPYATQVNGEIGGQITIYYKFKKGTALGGKYGTLLSLNYSRVDGLDTTHIMENGKYSRLNTYSLLGGKDKPYFEDFNVEITKKLSDKWKLGLMYIYLYYDRDVVESGAAVRKYPRTYSHIGIVDLTYQINEKHAIRTELQHLYTLDDRGSWALALLEYSVSPAWYVTVFDEWNYGNDEEKKRFHYPNVSVAYVKDAHRISFGYAKMRQGLLCVGGICRAVPSFNGFSVSLTSSF
ncbi:MAG: DUF6029 family protein [Bacteroidia bacterium]